MEQSDSSKDYYKVLGVTEDASAEDIVHGYRNRARELHPDRGGSEEAMKLLNQAYDTLGDETARRQYDQQRRPEKQKILYGSSAAFDPDAASKMGHLEIRVTGPDYIGLLIGAALCIGLGLPFLALIEMQYVFFLWPLRLLTIGVLLVGVLMARAALKMRHRGGRENTLGHARRLLEEAGFWLGTAGIIAITYLLVHSR